MSIKLIYEDLEDRECLGCKEMYRHSRYESEYCPFCGSPKVFEIIPNKMNMKSFKKNSRNVPPFKVSKRFWRHMCRYSCLTGSKADEPYWMKRVEASYFLLTRRYL